ncbi:hypothetical protein Tco_0265969 [Tanacetum coccineum]
MMLSSQPMIAVVEKHANTTRSKPAIPNGNLTDMLSKLLTANYSSTSGSGTLPVHYVYERRIYLVLAKKPHQFKLGPNFKIHSVYNHMTVQQKSTVIDMACDGILKRSRIFKRDREFVSCSRRYPTSSEVDPTYQDPEGDILLLEAILNSGTTSPLPKSEHICLGALLKVIKSHKRAIAWKLSDIKGDVSGICTHKILMIQFDPKSIKKENLLVPIRNFSLSSHAFWAIAMLGHVPMMYDAIFTICLEKRWKYLWMTFSLWRLFFYVPNPFGKDVDKAGCEGHQSVFKSGGKRAFHGKERHSSRT